MKVDQAQRLREFLRKQNKVKPKHTRVITITSGKGGVGKSNFVLNFALSMLDRNQKVVLIDLDLGMPNIDVLMGLNPRYNLYDMVLEDMSIWDIIEQGPNGLEYIAGGSDFQQFMDLEDGKLNRFFDQLLRLQGYADVILLDTGAGLSRESIRFILAADEVLLVTSSEPTSLTDAYAIIKTVQAKNPHVRFRLLVNRVSSYQEGEMTANKLMKVAGQFLNKELEIFGFILEDSHVIRSVKKQQPFYLAFPNCNASKEIGRLSDYFLSGKSVHIKETEMRLDGMRGFIQKMIRYIK